MLKMSPSGALSLYYYRGGYFYGIYSVHPEGQKGRQAQRGAEEFCRLPKTPDFHRRNREEYMEYGVRPIAADEIPFLRDFLYEAIYQRAGEEPLPKSIINRPELRVYVEDFGKEGDHCLVAAAGGRMLGAVWARLFSGPLAGFGTLDGQTPELAISLYKPFRGRGIGTALLREMLRLLKEKGYARASLAVQKENYAVAMYRKAGFEIASEDRDDYIMVCRL